MATTARLNKTEVWGGGRPPFGASYGKLMMWFFLVGDALSFGSLLVSYGMMRYKLEATWPSPGDVFVHFPFINAHVELAFVALMTFILIVSSVTMVLAVDAGHRNDKKNVLKWMGWTIVGGVIFLLSQTYEWYHFIHGTEDGVFKVIVKGGEKIGNLIHGANLTENEYGPPLFANFFFFITGFHGTHVLSGVILNIIIFFRVKKGVYEKIGHYEMVEKVGLYWHFVDLVWVFVFTFFYLI